MKDSPQKLTGGQCVQVLVVLQSAVTFGISLISLSCLYGLISDSFVKETGGEYTAYHKALIPGAHFLGAFVAGILLGFLPLNSNKAKLILANLIYAGTFATPLLTLRFVPYLLSRFVLGFALSLTSGSVASYISTISPDYIRGFLMSLQPVGIVGGLYIGSFFNYFGKDPDYKLPFAITLGFIGVQTIALFLVRDYNPRPVDTKRPSSTLGKLLRTPGSTRSILITMAFHAFYHLSGINFLTFQQVVIFSSYSNPNLMTNLSLLMGLISAGVCGQVIDRFGRKIITMTSSVLMAIGMTLLAMDRLLLLGVVVCLIGFNLGLAAVPWIISMEVFPIDYINVGLEFGVSVNWLFGFITTSLFYPLNEQYKQKMSAAYAILCIVFALFVSLCVRETKGRPRAFQ